MNFTIRSDLGVDQISVLATGGETNLLTAEFRFDLCLLPVRTLVLGEPHVERAVFDMTEDQSLAATGEEASEVVLHCGRDILEFLMRSRRPQLVTDMKAQSAEPGDESSWLSELVEISKDQQVGLLQSVGQSLFSYDRECELFEKFLC